MVFVSGEEYALEPECDNNYAIYNLNQQANEKAIRDAFLGLADGFAKTVSISFFLIFEPFILKVVNLNLILNNKYFQNQVLKDLYYL